MEQQSNNNIDALFQKAAEEYPLKTDNHNWDKVAANLHHAPVSLPTKKQIKWQYAALLLLLLTGGFFIVNNFYKTHTNNSNNKTDLITKKNTIKGNRQNAQSEKTNKKSNQDYLLNEVDKNTSTQTLKTNKLLHPPYGALQHGAPVFKNKDYPENKVPLNAGNHQLLNQTQLSAQPTLPLNPDNKVNQPGKKVNQPDKQNNKPATLPDKNIVQNLNQADKAGKKENVHIKSVPQPKTFYGTLFFSPDFSTIKFQHVNKPGYTIGIALGYRINSRFSAEIGLQRLHTNFYSDGKYFDKSNLKLKSTTIIDVVNGNNKLTEVPVNIKYNIQKNSDRFFVSAGTTLALITHNEKYNYDVTRDGSPDNISRNFNALTGTKYFSTINVSIGYQASVSNIFKVKFEPYYQAPIKGLGIGKLPISNFGANIGIVKDLK